MPRSTDPESYAIHDRRWWNREGVEPSESARPPTQIAALEAELAERDRRLHELSTLVRQGREELEQAKIRIEREAQREIRRRLIDVVGDWLIALDDLDRAIAAGRASSPDDPLLAGVELVRTNLLGRLSGQGVRRIEPTGAPFDPRYHEAIARLPVRSAEREGLVIETIAPGYLVGDELLRPARVAVGQFVPAA
jgi:molecular chaperone GrpE